MDKSTNSDSVATGEVDSVSPGRRRAMLGAAGVFGALAFSSRNAFSTPAEAAEALDWAAPPSGGDDSGILADAAKRGKLLRPGNYRCDKPIDAPAPTLIGVPGQTRIIANAPYVLDSNQKWYDLMVSGIKFEGRSDGKTRGFVRNRWAGTHILDRRQVVDCTFRNYSGVAVTMNQTDNPYIVVERNEFNGTNTTTSVGVALNGGNDLASISNNSFLNNKIAIAIMGGTAAHVHIKGNDILSLSAGKNRVGVWIVPTSPSATNSGMGCTISENKFGNENRDPSDYYILYADKGAGLVSGAAYPGDFGPKFAPSSRFVGLHMVHYNDFSGQGASTRAPIVTYTPNMLGNIFGPNVHSGTAPKVELEFAGPKPTQVTGTTVDPGRSWNPSGGIAHTNADSKFVRKVG